MPGKSESQILWAGRHLSMASRGGWEYVKRNTKRPAVGIVAVTDDELIVLVEQFRPPVGQPVVELPAGLAGDVAGAEQESLVEAAKRELLEETGYTAHRWTELGRSFSSPGLTDEAIVLFLAEGLTKSESGGGDESETITIHTVPIDGVLQWLADNNLQPDLKLLAGLYIAQRHRSSGGEHE
jgi:ADP-ribose pyrophosphatase